MLYINIVMFYHIFIYETYLLAVQDSFRTDIVGPLVGAN